jgi:hypothetical protein
VKRGIVCDKEGISQNYTIPSWIAIYIHMIKNVYLDAHIDMAG